MLFSRKPDPVDVSAFKELQRQKIERHKATEKAMEDMNKAKKHIQDNGFILMFVRSIGGDHEH